MAPCLSRTRAIMTLVPTRNWRPMRGLSCLTGMSSQLVWERLLVAEAWLVWLIFDSLRCVPLMLPFPAQANIRGHLTNRFLRFYSSHKSLMGVFMETGELIQGTLEMLVLKALQRGPLHGYSVAEWIQETSQQMLKVEEGALYPALHRMELRGLLKSKWGTSENNRRAKFYVLTNEGQKRLDAESQRWARLSSAVAFVMQAS